MSGVWPYLPCQCDVHQAVVPLILSDFVFEHNKRSWWCCRKETDELTTIYIKLPQWQVQSGKKRTRGIRKVKLRKQDNIWKVFYPWHCGQRRPFFFSTAELKCFYYPVLKTGGGKEVMYTLLQSCTWYIFNIIKEKYIEKMYPSECGRALKYIICEGKNGCSIIPKKEMQKASSS